jgi:thiol:disulfide interchange protein DsbA
MFQACIKLIICLWLIFSPVCNAEPVIFKEGEHYEKIDISVLADDLVKQHIAQDTNKIQVIEFFSYGCYWCSQVHPPLVEWAAMRKNFVAIYNYPVAFNQLWRELGKLYLTVQQLDNAHIIDEQIFNAIHHEQIRVWEEDEIRKIILKNGGNFEVFNQYINSFVINSKLRKSELLSKAYKIDATPYIIIHGPHASYVTSLSKTRNQELLIKVVDYLVMREQKFYQPANQQS